VGDDPRGDLEILTEQLGRVPSIRFGVIVRCHGGHPLVIRNHHFDTNGDPFPNLYWLTCPEVSKAVSRLESEGAIGELNRRFDADADFARAVERAHEEYARERARNFAEAELWGGVGGTRKGIKCLHAHLANHLAGGDDPIGYWVASRIGSVHGEAIGGRVAVIDQGTNSIRLLVVEPGVDGSPKELARDMIITRLGKDVDRTGRLDAEALVRTLDVVRRYCRRARALHAERTRMSATSAVRDASNREELAEMVRRETGEDLQVISGEREAELSFLGSASEFDVPRPLVVLDIGGGSTEFVVGDDVPRHSVSVQLGSVRLTERFVRHDPATGEELDAVRGEIARVLEAVDERLPMNEARTMVAVAGTATTVQAISLGLQRYDSNRIHRSLLALEDVEEVLARLQEMTTAEKAGLPVMAPGRADVIVAGAEILAAVMRRWGFRRAFVSEYDILDGLAAELLANR
jgi:exopolyphosphatase/guanosine-5'-triphosphate,3'-diphosphate pyrophosphatase